MKKVRRTPEETAALLARRVQWSDGEVMTVKEAKKAYQMAHPADPVLMLDYPATKQVEIGTVFTSVFLDYAD
jgi:hypothetical protein